MYREFQSLVENRRSIYGLSDDTSVDSGKIAELVRHSIRHAPSAMNSQSARTVILFGDHHKKLWNLTKEILRKLVPAESFQQTEKKIDSFSAGAGTVLFFEDRSVVENLQKQYPLYADNFQPWALEASGMLQYIVWTALSASGLGASLQHYNPLIDDNVRREWNIPDNWKLVSEMVFGKPVAEPSEKKFLPVEERVLVFD
jgi:hypothetical protein